MNKEDQNSAYCIEYFTAKPGNVNELQKSLLSLAVKSKQEPGCIQYDVLKDTNNENTFILVLKFTSTKTMQEHENQDYIKEFAENDMNRLCSEVKWHDAELVT